MMPLEIWVHTPAAQALGWTLFHSLWEGLLAALVLAAALCFARSAGARYVAACAALAAMLGAFGFTFARMLAAQEARAVMIRPQALPLAPRDDGPDSGGVISPNRAISDLLPWFAPFWMAGVLVFHARAAAGWMGVRRLRCTGVCCAPEWQERLNALAARLRVARPVKLLESCLTEAPVAVGYLRPVILAPIGLLAGLPAGQVESILIHELAHIRRHDYLLNLLQTMAESLLFYHPATWWISRVIRAERENCCDDWVLALNGDAREYAAALAALEENRSAPRQAALAANGGSLVKRIRRLLDRPEKRHTALAPAFSAGVLTVTAAVALMAWQSKPAPAPQQQQAAPPVQGTEQPTTIRGLERQRFLRAEVPAPYGKWLNGDVAYIITDRERAAFKQLQTDDEREHFIEQFWLRRDPTPGTPENEYKEEHYRRIAYANEHYASSVPGWKTDRGRIYIQYGPPDEIETHPGGTADRPPYEQWLYKYIEGIGYNVIVEFVDRDRTGDFRMTTDPAVEKTQPGAMFYSSERGAFASVEVMPDRTVRVKVPLEFQARRYSLAGNLTTSYGQPVRQFEESLVLCKTAPGIAGCLAQPEFRGVLPLPQLAPGAYTFTVVVKDAASDTQKTYTVNFSVTQ